MLLPHLLLLAPRISSARRHPSDAVHIAGGCGRPSAQRAEKLTQWHPRAPAGCCAACGQLLAAALASVLDPRPPRRRLRPALCNSLVIPPLILNRHPALSARARWLWRGARARASACAAHHQVKLLLESRGRSQRSHPRRARVTLRRRADLAIETCSPTPALSLSLSLYCSLSLSLSLSFAHTLYLRRSVQIEVESSIASARGIAVDAQPH